MIKEPIYISETSVDAFHKRLASLTATAPKGSKEFKKASCILRFEAEKKSREVKIEGDFSRDQRFEMWWASRPSRSIHHWFRLSNNLKEYGY